MRAAGHGGQTGRAPKIRVMIADDHPVLRAGLRILIDAQDDMEVVAEAGSAAECFDSGLETGPDVTLLDISMPGGSGLEALKRLREAGSASRFLVLTMHSDADRARSALAAGATGYVTKDATPSEVLGAIRTLHGGRSYIAIPISGSGVGGLLPAGSPEAAGAASADRPALTAREVEVLRSMAQGHTNKETATRLHLSVKTVEGYRARFASKLGARRRSDLVRYAMEAGLLVQPDDESP